MAEIEVTERPLHERLAWGQPLHETLLARLNARQQLSERHIENRYDSWNQVDEHCRLYIDLSRNAKKADRSTDRDKKEMPFQRAIVVPMSVAILQVRLVELMGIFLANDPPIQLVGTGPEDVKPAKLMTTVMNYDLRQMGFVLQLYSLLQDAEKYGLGVAYDTWDQQPGWIYRKLAPNADPRVRMMLQMQGVPDVEREWGIVKEHNRWEAVDPFNFWPDPRASMADIQRSEYIGHRNFRSYLWLKEREMENGGNYFNLDELRRTPAGEQYKHLRSRDRAMMDSYSMNASADELDRGFHCIDTMQIKLIPRDWELSEETKPEIWWFSWANKSTIIRAHPSAYEHNQFTYSAFESNPDPHVDFNPGTIENLDGLQRVHDWLFNCFSEDTEFLTESGWKLYDEIGEADRIATVEGDSGEVWYEKPAERFEYEYDGEMVDIQTKRLDLRVTPNHRMWVEKQRNCGQRVYGADGNLARRVSWKEYEPWGFVDAGEMRGTYRVPQRVDWKGGIDQGELVFDEQKPKRFRGRKPRYPEVRIPYDQLADFLGYYVSEGSVSGNYNVSIRQKKPETVMKIDGLMSKFPFHVTRYVDEKDAVSWSIGDRRFATWLRKNAGTHTKRVPGLVFGFNARLIRRFLETAIDGDGSRVTSNLARYDSTSKPLADGIHICALKAGWTASLTDRGRITSGKHVYGVNIGYERAPATATTYLPSQIRRTPYRGRVVCFENSTHLLVVRRNGKVAICGNSHIENARRHLNNSMIYGPSWVEEEDIINRNAGGNFRLTARGSMLVESGRLNVDQLFKQVQLTDVTRSHLNDGNLTMDMGMRYAGTADQQMAQTARANRTLGEIERVLSSSSKRMAIVARFMDTMGMQPLVERSVSNRQQFTEVEQYFRIAGEMMTELGIDSQQILIRPDDLAGNFDYVSNTGALPPDPARQAEIWIRMLEGIASLAPLGVPGISLPDERGRQIDVKEVFNEAAKNGGAKNIERFYRIVQAPPQVMPDEQLQQGIQQGNIVPFEEAA